MSENSNTGVRPKALDVPNLIRRVRRVCDLSQADLAARLGVNQSTVARWETGAVEPSLTRFQELMALAGWEVVVDDGESGRVSPMRDDAARDRGGRRIPAHLDLIPFWPYSGPLRPRCPESHRSVPRRALRDEFRQREGHVVRDHWTEAHLATIVGAAQRERRDRNRALVDRLMAARVARGEPDPRLPGPPCTCPIECEETPGCVPECTCGCDRVEVNDHAVVVGDPMHWW